MADVCTTRLTPQQQHASAHMYPGHVQSQPVGPGLFWQPGTHHSLLRGSQGSARTLQGETGTVLLWATGRQAGVTTSVHMGCTQVGPELEVPGYGCEDHFIENDTLEHSWEVIAELIKGRHSSGMTLRAAAAWFLVCTSEQQASAHMERLVQALCATWACPSCTAACATTAACSCWTARSCSYGPRSPLRTMATTGAADLPWMHCARYSAHSLYAAAVAQPRILLWPSVRRQCRHRQVPHHSHVVAPADICTGVAC